MLPLTRSRNRSRFFGIPFSPASLFANGEQGAWYDPSDLSTMFNDAAGTQPITSFTTNQPVGLLLDKSKGLVLGPELVTNGDFSAGTTGWTAQPGTTFAVTSGVASVTGNQGFVGQPFTTVVGRWYKATGTLKASPGIAAFAGIRKADDVGNTVNVVNVITASAPTTVDQTRSVFFVATATTTYINIQSNSAGTALVDDIFVQALPGNHATASGSARPVLSKRYNLLTRTEEFNDVAWTKTNCTAVNTTATTDPLGGTTAELVTTSGSDDLIQGSITVSAGASYTASVVLKKGSFDWIRLRYEENSGTSSVRVWANLSTGSLGTGSAVSPGTYQSSSIVSLGNGWYRISVTGIASTSTTCRIVICSSDADNSTSRAASGSTYYAWGADLRRTIDANAFQPAYQRVVTATDYDGDGFLPYLEYSGAQAMATGSIDFTAGDKMSVWAGVTKLSDAAVGFLVGHQTWPVTGGFGLYAPSYISAPGAKYYLGLQGTSLGQVEYATYAAPITNVLSNALDIGGAAISDEIKTRINGVSVVASASSGSAGTGNFPNTPLTIGAYNAGGNFFTGRQYSLIVRGAQSSAAQISATESWVAQRTGVAL